MLENKFFQPTDIQSSVLEVYRYYNDFILASQTGSGKTLAFGIPIISEILFAKKKQQAEEHHLNNTDPNQPNAPLENRLKKKKGNYLRALIIAPTRELVFQIEDHLKQINKYSKDLILIGSLVGGMSKQKQNRILSYRPDILIATPGRLWDMIETD